MRKYRMYGLNAESQWHLPECLPLPDDCDADIVIKRGLVSPLGVKTGPDGSWIQAREDEFWIDIDGVARFLVSRGREIIVEPYADADEASIRVYLLGSVIGALLFQRSLLLIHGNAIEVNGGCLVCVGDSGAGKSTLAAAFLQHGYRLLADDVVPISEDGLATPGFPRIKLWGDTALRFGIETAGLRPIVPGMDKYNVPLGDGFCETPLPVKWLYVLEPSDEDGFSCEPFGGVDRFGPLHENTYRVHFLEHMALKPRHLQQVAKLAGNIHMARIRRPKAGFKIDELLEFIMEDIGRNS